MGKILMKGNEAVGEAAIIAGCRHYFGYPITPQNEIPAYMAMRLPRVGGTFLQAESEIAAINMVYGASAAGARVMTSSSSPGISLKMEGISYMAGAELPAVVVNMMRGGPGLGNIAASQGDYNQIVHGGGHGDYHPIVLAPASIQEAVDLLYDFFDIVEKYLAIGILLVDGSLGQMMEPVEMPPMRPLLTKIPPYAVSGAKGRERRFLSSIDLDPYEEEKTNLRLLQRWQAIEKNEIRFKDYYMEDARFAVVGFGSAGRIALSAVRAARAEGIPVGLIRPISLSPFPSQALLDAAKKLEGMLVVEMNSGMMLSDVQLAVKDKLPVEFYGRLGGVTPFPDEVLGEIRSLAKGPLKNDGLARERWLSKLENLRSKEKSL